MWHNINEQKPPYNILCKKYIIKDSGIEKQAWYHPIHKVFYELITGNDNKKYWVLCNNVTEWKG